MDNFDINWDTSATDFFEATAKEGTAAQKTVSPTFEENEEQLLWQHHQASNSAALSPQLEPLLEPIPPSPPPTYEERRSNNQSMKSYEEMVEEQLAKSQTAEPLYVTVADPIKEGSGTDVHITYLVSNRKTKPTLGYEPSEYEPVRRRFRDFVWLRKMLSGTYLQCAIPPMAEKHRIS